MTQRERVVRDTYRAWQDGDRDLIERCLSQDLSFYSPPDPGLDRGGYVERCWPHAGHTQRFDLKRLIETDDEVVVTYEATRPDGTQFRNTEIFTFDEQDRIKTIEVYFGWNLSA